MADNLIESGSEDEQSDEEVVVDHENECIEAILVQLDRPDLQPTRENIRLIATGVTELFLNGEDIHVLSDCINELQDLEDLDLDNNQLSELPDDLNLPNLKVIFLISNKFTSYPSALKQHNKIEEIIFYNNQITELPADAFKYNSNLKALSLSGNPLGHVPSCLMHCTGLTWLGIDKCNLTSVPEWFGKKLKNLDTLYLDRNPDLVELPNSIRFVKQAIFNENNKMRERNDIKLSQDCDRIEAMVQAASDRVWESRRILLTARPGPPPISQSKYKLRSKTNNCHEVLFGGSEERQKSITKLILQYLI